jgi:hypothetical protein
LSTPGWVRKRIEVVVARVERKLITGDSYSSAAAIHWCILLSDYEDLTKFIAPLHSLSN